MTHQMKLNDAPFEMIEQRMKTIELRLWDEKRRSIAIGDKIAFIHAENSPTSRFEQTESA